MQKCKNSQIENFMYIANNYFYSEEGVRIFLGNAGDDLQN